MKKDTHPTYQDITFTCACGATFTAGSTIKGDFKTEICSKCHPFYTGKQKLVDTARRVEKFQAKIAGAKKMSGAKKGKTAKRVAKATTKAAKTVKIAETTASSTVKKITNKKKEEKKITKKTDKK